MLRIFFSIETKQISTIGKSLTVSISDGGEYFVDEKAIAKNSLGKYIAEQTKNAHAGMSEFVSKRVGYCCPIHFANLANRETLVFAGSSMFK
jgi:hypothetical protein